MNPPIFGKLYPFGVRFQHKTKQIPRNVDRFGHRNRTKPVRPDHFGADFMELSPYFHHAASLDRGFCNIFKCTRVVCFVAMPSQSPSLPFDSVQARRHGQDCVDFGQQTNMWFYTYSSMLCPQRVKRNTNLVFSSW